MRQRKLTVDPVISQKNSPKRGLDDSLAVVNISATMPAGRAWENTNPKLRRTAGRKQLFF